MPSHATAAIRALPALGCVGDSTLQDMCAGSDKTYEILENILTEVMDLFPSPFIHVGGDEYFGVSWTKCPHCQKRLKEENLDSQDTERLRNLFAKCAGDKKKYLLYRYMMRRVCHFVVSKGRQPILWDAFRGKVSFPRAPSSSNGTLRVVTMLLHARLRRRIPPSRLHVRDTTCSFPPSRICTSTIRGPGDTCTTWSRPPQTFRPTRGAVFWVRMRLYGSGSPTSSTWNCFLACARWPKSGGHRKQTEKLRGFCEAIKGPSAASKGVGRSSNL